MDSQGTETTKMKFCKHCGAQIAEHAVICTVCGRQVEEMKSANAPQPTIVINNENNNTNTNLNAAPQKSPKNKWAALALCFFWEFLERISFTKEKSAWGFYTCLPADYAESARWLILLCCSLSRTHTISKERALNLCLDRCCWQYIYLFQICDGRKSAGYQISGALLIKPRYPRNFK